MSDKKAALIAKPVREAIKKLLKQRLTNMDERKRMAKHLGKSLSAINSCVNSGVGGFDTVISILFTTYQIKKIPSDKYYNILKSLFEKKLDSKKSDSDWTESLKRFENLRTYFSEAEISILIKTIEKYGKMKKNIFDNEKYPI